MKSYFNVVTSQGVIRGYDVIRSTAEELVVKAGTAEAYV